VIVRIMGEGQFEIDEEVAKGLNDLDQQAEQALEAGDAERLGELLERMAEAVRFRHAVWGPDELFYGDLYASRKVPCVPTFSRPGTRDEYSTCVAEEPSIRRMPKIGSRSVTSGGS